MSLHFPLRLDVTCKSKRTKAPGLTLGERPVCTVSHAPTVASSVWLPSILQFVPVLSSTSETNQDSVLEAWLCCRVWVIQALISVWLFLGADEAGGPQGPCSACTLDIFLDTLWLHLKSNPLARCCQVRPGCASAPLWPVKCDELGLRALDETNPGLCVLFPCSWATPHRQQSGGSNWILSRAPRCPRGCLNLFNHVLI